MTRRIEYRCWERVALWCVAVFGFCVVNGAFVYGMCYQPQALEQALTNPISAAFILEALVLMGVFAYLLTRWGVSSLHWGWFVVLSLLGSMAFAVPVVLLWPFTRTSYGRGAQCS